MSDHPRFWGSAASSVLLMWMYLTACGLVVAITVDPTGFEDFVGATGALMIFCSPLGLIGWRYYGWWLMLAMAAVGFALLPAALFAVRR